jgi:hypothetical protein
LIDNKNLLILACQLWFAIEVVESRCWLAQVALAQISASPQRGTARRRPGIRSWRAVAASVPPAFVDYDVGDAPCRGLRAVARHRVTDAAARVPDGSPNLLLHELHTENPHDRF